MSLNTLANARWTVCWWHRAGASRRHDVVGCLLACALVALGCDGDTNCGEAPSDHHGPNATCGLQANCIDTIELEEGLRVESEDGAFTVEVVSHAPLASTGNEIVIAVENADGDPVTDAELDVDVFSVDCMHGGPNPPDAVSADADGNYELAPVHLHGGPWDTVIEIDADGETDTARLHFCVPGDDHGDGGATDDHEHEAEHCH